MSSHQHPHGALTLLVLTLSPALEEDLIDCLLGLEGVDSFTSQEVYGHGEHGVLSVAEQVSGRRKRLQVSVLLPPALIDTVLAALLEEVGKDIDYREQPLGRVGHLG